MTDVDSRRHTDGSPGTFVGRAAELAQLDTGLSDALRGRGRVYLLSGDPGIGKTRLAEILAERAAAGGWTVLWGRCWESGGAPAFWPWVQALRGYARTTGEGRLVAPGESRRGHNLPELAALVGAGDDRALGTADPDQTRFLLFDTTVNFLRTAAAERPLLLILDDLHAADVDSLLLLRFLARALSDIRLLTIGTYRDADARAVPAIGALLGDVARDATSLRLHGWSEAEVTEYLTTSVRVPTPGVRPNAELARAVSRITEGNPFFVEEIVRLWQAEGAVPEAPAQGPIALHIPDHVRNAVRQRLALLPAASRDILDVAAVIGREFDFAVLSQICAQPDTVLRDLLGAAVPAAIIIELSSAPLRYSFSHVLIRDTLYHDLGASRRAALHGAVARAIETVRAAVLDTQLADVAYHYFLADSEEAAAPALSYARRAAERATANCAYADAVVHCEQALDVCTRFPARDPSAAKRLRCELLLSLGEAQNMAGTRTEARETFRQAGDLARELQQPEAFAQAALGYGGLWGGPEELLKLSKAQPGHFDDTLPRLLREARDMLGSRDPALRARLLSRLAIEVYFSQTPAQRDVLTQEALTIARRLDDPRTLAVVLWNRHAAIWGPDSVRARLAMAEEIVELAERIGEYGLELAGRAWLIGDLLELGEGSRVEVEFERFRRLAESYRQPIHLWGLRNCCAQQALLAGDFENVPQLANEALALGLKIFMGAFIAYGVQMTTLYRERGQLDELRATEAGLQGFITQYPDLPNPRVALAHLMVVTGRLEEARVELDRLAARAFDDLPRDLGWSSAMVELTEVCAALGDTRRAVELYRLMLPCAAYVAVSPYHAMCWGAMARSLGVLAAMLEDWTAAEAHFAVALECNRRIKARPWVARTQYDYAAMLCARGHPADQNKARALLDAALAAADTLGMHPLLQRVEALIAQLAVPAPVSEAASKSRSAGATTNRFVHDGDVWQVVYAGRSCSLKDARGLHFIAELLRQPRHKFHAIELVKGAGGAAVDGDFRIANLQEVGEVRMSSDAGAMLDAQSKAAYKRRLNELRQELDKAHACNDPGRIERARTEIELITQELTRAVGLGGRDRPAVSDAERARVNVTRAVAAAVKKISERHPELGHHLAETIKTGTFCAYKPDPRVPIDWDVAV